MTTNEDPQDGRSEPGFSFNDKRRIDPETGEVRSEGASQSQGQDGTAGPDTATGRDRAAEAPAGSGEPAADPATASGADAPQDQAAAADAADLGVEIPDDASALADDVAGDGDLSPDARLAEERLQDLQRINAEYAAYRMRATREQDRARETGAVALAEALIPVLDEVRLAKENGDVTGQFEVHVTKLIDALAKAGVVQFGEVGEEFDPAFHEALMQQPSDEVDGPTVFMVMQSGYRFGERIIRPARVGVQQPAD